MVPYDILAGTIEYSTPNGDENERNASNRFRLSWFRRNV